MTDTPPTPSPGDAAPRDVTPTLSPDEVSQRIIERLGAEVERLTAERDALAYWRETVQTYVAEQIEAAGSDPAQASSPFAAIGLIAKRTAERDALREGLDEIREMAKAQGINEIVDRIDALLAEAAHGR